MKHGQNTIKSEADSERKMMWYSLALMAFSTVWGFGNVINGFTSIYCPLDPGVGSVLCALHLDGGGTGLSLSKV